MGEITSSAKAEILQSLPDARRMLHRLLDSIGSMQEYQLTLDLLSRYIPPQVVLIDLSTPVDLSTGGSIITC
jgi:hypothetical protein